MAPERSTVVDADLLDDITMTSVPDDVIVPSDGDSLDEQTNPINGRRGGPRPADDDDDGCEIGLSEPCVTSALDLLGFDVTSRPTQGRERQVRRAIAVVQLDAGLPETGSADAALLDYLGIATGDTTTHDTTTHDTTTHDTTHDPAETRRIGVSAEGRPIMAMRYGDGPRTVLVVGQTHGDEEGGLRILLRARTLDVPDAVTLWVIPTMNPDGLVHDTRFLANGADPNRHAPSEPEQDAVYDFAMTIRPSLSVWYHQNYGWVGGSGASYAPAKEYQRLTGLGTLKRSGDCTVRGFMWCPIDAALGSSSILVELEDVLTPADVQIHARALLEVAAGPDP